MTLSDRNLAQQLNYKKQWINESPGKSIPGTTKNITTKKGKKYHRNVNAGATEVFAKDGIVTLRGEASSKAQKQLTTEYAKDVEGVKNVKNEMTVLTAAMKPGEKTVGEKVDAISESMDDASITGQGQDVVAVPSFDQRS